MYYRKYYTGQDVCQKVTQRNVHNGTNTASWPLTERATFGLTLGPVPAAVHQPGHMSQYSAEL